jgi:hypothetical protein
MSDNGISMKEYEALLTSAAFGAARVGDECKNGDEILRTVAAVLLRIQVALAEKERS